MTSFTNLPEQVITSVCGDWLNAKSVGSLDTAVSNSKMRPHFLAALRNAPISCHKVLCSKPMYPNDMKYYVMLFSFCNWFQKRVQWEEHVKSMAATIDLSHDHATIIQALEAAGIALGQYDFVYGVNIDINAFADGTDYGKRLSWFISHFPLAREIYVQVPKFEVAPTTQICNVLNNNPRFGRIYFDFVRDFESACAQFENNRQSDCFRPIRERIVSFVRLRNFSQHLVDLCPKIESAFIERASSLRLLNGLPNVEHLGIACASSGDGYNAEEAEATLSRLSRLKVLIWSQGSLSLLSTLVHRLPSIMRIKHGHFDLDRSSGKAVLTLLNPKPPQAEYTELVNFFANLPFKIHTVIMWAYDEGTVPVLLGSHWDSIRVLEPKCKLAVHNGIYKVLLRHATSTTQLTFAPAPPGQANPNSKHVDDLLEYGQGLSTLHIGGIGKIHVSEEQLTRIVTGLPNLSSILIQAQGDTTCSLDTMVRILASTGKVWDKIEWGFIDPSQLAKSMRECGLQVKQFVYLERITAITVTVGHGKVPMPVEALERVIADREASRVA